jgi:hypothetical protein
MSSPHDNPNNPAKKTSRKREILNQKRAKLGTNVSCAVWRKELNLAEVIVQKGKIWMHMGITINGKLFCTVEEATYMAERCNLLVYSDGQLLSVRDLYSLLSRQQVSWESYYSYTYMKKAGSGYILLRKPALWRCDSIQEFRDAHLHASVAGAATKDEGVLSGTVTADEVNRLKDEVAQQGMKVREVKEAGKKQGVENPNHFAKGEIDKLLGLKAKLCKAEASLAIDASAVDAKESDLEGERVSFNISERLQQKAAAVPVQSLGAVPSKRLKTEGGNKKVAAGGQQSTCRGWMPALNPSHPWLTRTEPIPRVPESAFNPTVLESQTMAFPNLWAFKKRKDFASDEENLSSKAFDVYKMHGNPIKRRTPPESDFSLHVSRDNTFEWNQAHGIANVNRLKTYNRSSKISFIDGASALLFTCDSIL